MSIEIPFSSISNVSGSTQGQVERGLWATLTPRERCPMVVAVGMELD